MCRAISRPLVSSGKLPSLQNIHLNLFEVLSVAFGTGHSKHEIAFAPDNQRRRLILTKIGMPFLVTIEVAGVIGV